MLDTKSTFDDLVVANAATPEQGQRILPNRFYSNISGALSDTHKDMAMEKLYELNHETDFDLLVVDTPQTCNPIDFTNTTRPPPPLLAHHLSPMTTPTRRPIQT